MVGRVTRPAAAALAFPYLVPRCAAASLELGSLVSVLSFSSSARWPILKNLCVCVPFDRFCRVGRRRRLRRGVPFEDGSFGELDGHLAHSGAGFPCRVKSVAYGTVNGGILFSVRCLLGVDDSDNGLDVDLKKVSSRHVPNYIVKCNDVSCCLGKKEEAE